MTGHEQVVARVFGLYERFGTSDYIGEPVSQIEHMSQAAELAMAEGFDDEVVLAAFFHDIGHLCAEGAENMGGYGVVSHERLGADYLREAGFSERLARHRCLSRQQWHILPVGDREGLRRQSL